jgi:chromosome segregation ATPase
MITIPKNAPLNIVASPRTLKYAAEFAQQEISQYDGKIGREENRITLLEERISKLNSGGLDVSDSVNAQIEIRDGAWDRVQGDIDFAQGQIDSLRTELKTLDTQVAELRNKGVETITVDEGVFNDEVQVIDYVAQADQLYDSQKEIREQIRADIKDQQNNIDKYRDHFFSVLKQGELWVHMFSWCIS